jgi:hypothetical protein
MTGWFGYHGMLTVWSKLESEEQNSDTLGFR